MGGVRLIGGKEYWDIVQDALADLVRVMLGRCFDSQRYPELYDHCRNLRGELWVCAFPNLFVTIAPAEWKFPMPYFLLAYLNFIVGGAYIMALHMLECGGTLTRIDPSRDMFFTGAFIWKRLIC